MTQCAQVVGEWVCFPLHYVGIAGVVGLVLLLLLPKERG